MKRTNGFLRLAAVLAMSFLALAGCNNGTEEKDIWSDITSLDQVNGT